MVHWLFLPNEALDDLETLASLSDEKIQKLRGFLDSSEFRPKYSVYVKISDLLGLSDESAARLCTFINYVQKQRIKNAKSGETIPDEIENFLRRITGDKERGRAEKVLGNLHARAKLLSGLFSELPEYELSAKVRGLETGPLPHLKSFRTLCDIRPVYDTEAENIVSFFPTITLSLVTHAFESDETKEFFVQLTESDIGEFKKQFDRLEKKLAKLKAHFPSPKKKEESG
jgi:hypothetical protein